MCDNFSIKETVLSALEDFNRTSYSEDGFSKKQMDSIAEAISKAISEYDKQNHSQK